MAKHKCTNCGMRFNTRNDFKAHVRASLTCKDTQCPTCDKICANVAGLQSHCKSKRHGPGITMNVYCQVCKQGFPTVLGLESHMNDLGHFTVNPNLISSTSTPTNYVRWGHDIENPSLGAPTGPKTHNYRCTVCQQVFPDRGARKSHRRDQHGPRSIPLTCIKCPTCEQVFSTHECLVAHCESNRHGPMLKVYCQVCKRGFKGLPGLESHAKNTGHPAASSSLVTDEGDPSVEPTSPNPSTYIDGRDTPDSADKVDQGPFPSSTDKSFQCYLCLQPPFKTFDSLKLHLNSHRDDEYFPELTTQFSMLSTM